MPTKPGRKFLWGPQTRAGDRRQYRTRAQARADILIISNAATIPARDADSRFDKNSNNSYLRCQWKRGRTWSAVQSFEEGSVVIVSDDVELGNGGAGEGPGLVCRPIFSAQYCSSP